MIKCAIVEHVDERVDSGASRSSNIENDARFPFKGRDGFSVAFREAVAHLFGKQDEDPNGNLVRLLIIGAHGMPLTGTELYADESDDGAIETVNFDMIRDHFQILPRNLVIYLHTCWGAYPAAAALTSGDSVPGMTDVPLVVGPLVRIDEEDSEKFLADLRSTIANGISIDAIKTLVDSSNSNKGNRSKYFVDYVFGMHLPDGEFHPEDSRGQLAAVIESSEDFEIDSFRCNNGQRNVHCVLRGLTQTDKTYLTPTSCIPFKSKENIKWESFDVTPYLGSKIVSKYQVIPEPPKKKPDPDSIEKECSEYIRIVLVSPRMTKPHKKSSPSG